MKVRAASSRVLELLFLAAMAAAYLGIAAGFLGFIPRQLASLIALTGCAIACISGLMCVIVLTSSRHRWL